MSKLNWDDIKSLADQKANLFTKTGIPFQIVAASDGGLTVRVRSGEEHTINRRNLEKAVIKIQSGMSIKGPKDYRDMIADDRPAYAWAILVKLGYLGR